MTRNGIPKVYLAGPLGFSAPGLLYHDTVIVPEVRKAGFEVLDPWDVPAHIHAVFALPRDDIARRTKLVEANAEAGGRNAEMIRSCNGVLAVLDGPDVDSGTAAEIGYAAALGRPVVGLRTDLRVSGDNEATIVNLQVEWFIRSTGGELYTSLDDAIAKLVALVQ